MDEELLALFLSEARERIALAEGVLENGDLTSENAATLRRELHALKGASRMLGLGELSDLVHRGEEVLEPLGPDSSSAIVRVLDEIATTIDDLASGTSGAPGGATPVAERSDVASLIPEDAEVQLARAELDLLSDNETKMRVVSTAAGTLIQSLFQLAHAAESGVADRHPEQILAAVANRLRSLAFEAESGQRTMNRLIGRQLDILLGAQMQPIEPLFRRLARHARQLAESLGREVDVRVAVERSQLDRRIVRSLGESLLHLVRNAVDHGIEPRSRRLAQGKPGAGTIELRATRAGDRIRIEVADDGRGVSPEDVMASARERGLDVALDGAMPPEAILQILFTQGFSTTAEATEISGRGIGLDAVAAAVQRVGGEVWMQSTPGVGTAVTLDIPVAQSGERVVLLGIGAARLGIPAAVVRSYRVIGPDAARAAREEHGRTVVLADLVGYPSTGATTEVFVESGGVRLRLVVDGIHGEEEVLTRPVPRAVGRLPLYSGIALRADGQPVALLDPSHILAALAEFGAAGVPVTVPVSPLRVLLVDDSRATRAMMRRFLEDEGFEVEAAANGVEAWALVRSGDFDCVVTDIEMPEMDGLELTRRIRGEDSIDALPIVVVSTRDRTADRMAGLEAGADSFMSKQRLDSEDLAVVIRRLGGRG